MASVVEVWRYPVKSMAGERLGSCAVKETGLEGDRRWALIDGTPSRAGKALTIREHEGLMTYQARLANGGVELLAPDGSSHELDGTMVARLAAETSRPLTVRKLEGGNFDDSPDTRDTCMGVYCRVVRPGRVAQGDPVRVVSVT